MSATTPRGRCEREFARIGVRLPARVRPLDPEEASRLRTALASQASVWSPSGEASLRELVNSGGGTAEATLAQAVLDLTDQVVRLRNRLLEDHSGLVAVEIGELSGGGGRLLGPLPLQIGDQLELRFTDEEEGIPPVRTIVEIVHRGQEQGVYGFRFETLHPRDRDRLIRFVYRLQRLALRESRR